MAKQKIEQLVSSCGITIDGEKAYDPQITDDRFYKRIIKDLAMGAGESYMEQWWHCEKLDELIYHFTRNLDPASQANKMYWAWQWVKNLCRNPQSRLRSKKVAEQHYNVNSDFYRAVLGPSMAYTCGYWKDATDVDSAQYAKYQLICDKLQLKSTDHVLDLGCGWGGLAHYMTERYGCQVTAINNSTEQTKYANQHSKNDKTTFVQCDYRDWKAYNPKQIKYDKITSVGMCEHIGLHNYATYINTFRQNLKDDGLAVLHTIGKNNSSYYADPWIRKYIFPGGYLPSISQLAKQMEDRFVVEDLHNFGADYDKTLIGWHKNLQNHWPTLKANFDDRFYRMWEYYLLSCAGAFRARDMQLWQWVLSPKGVVSGYQSIR